MATNYGLVYTEDQAKQQLLNQNRDYNNRLTWQTMLNNNSLQAQRAENQLIKQYTDASVDAYTSYLKSQNAIKNSQVVGQGEQQLLNENDQALLDIYNSYKQSLSSGLADVATADAEGAESINQLLEDQAKMTADYTNAHYSYLQALYDKYLAGENDYFAEGNQWNKYTTYDQLKDENGNPVYDENGNPVLDETSPRLMNWNEITNPANGYYNADGTLTLKGVDFFDQLENQIANEDGYTWGKYLAETNPDLLDWANSYNPYNYTQSGTNAGTMRTMYGMMSTDEEYSFAERFGGLNKEQVDAMYEDYTSAAEELGNAIASSGKDKGKSQIQAIEGYVTSISEMAKELGIKQDIEEALGMSFEELSVNLDDMINQARTSGEMARDWFTTYGTGVGTGAAGGAAIGWGAGKVLGTAAGAAGGALLGAGAGAVPGAAAGAAAGGGIGAGAGAVIGAVVGAIGGIIKASIDTDNQRNLNKQLAEQSHQLYNELLNTMITYSQNKRRQAEIDFNTANIY